MNRDIIERSHAYSIIGKMVGRKKNTVKAYFKRNGLDVANVKDIAFYLKKYELYKQGVYEIFNLITKKSYIGKSSCIAERWKQHRYALSKGQHRNESLQEDYNEYGEDSFNIRVLEFVENKEDLKEREHYYIRINSPDNLYNKKHSFVAYMHYIRKWRDNIYNLIVELEGGEIEDKYS